MKIDPLLQCYELFDQYKFKKALLLAKQKINHIELESETRRNLVGLIIWCYNFLGNFEKCLENIKVLEKNLGKTMPEWHLGLLNYNKALIIKRKENKEKASAIFRKAASHYKAHRENEIESFPDNQQLVLKNLNMLVLILIFMVIVLKEQD
ncbi:MAG: hypothetical protein HeimC3_12860 [Candidatus Heimdallarchaeota archaeon LC_3]|nr:MAG: hypothetical protein HeimC3_12860 [Candidatus Heimdallarchaeota archaeon LC_3]